MSPTNAQGPVGANLTLSGSSWYGENAGQAVSLSASATSCSASGTTSLGQAQIDSDGTFTATVVWPTSLASPGAAYALCATSDGAHFATAPQSYRVRSALPPALALSLPTVGVGQQTQIGGANFVGAASVKVTLTTAQGTRTLASVTPDPKDGSFMLTYSPTAKDLGSASLSAASSPDGDAPPALQASAQFQVVAAVPTATTAPPTPSVATAAPATASSSSGASFAGAILLAVGSLLVVLFLIGAVAWIFLMPVRSRRTRRVAARPRSGFGGRRAPATVSLASPAGRQHRRLSELPDALSPRRADGRAGAGMARSLTRGRRATRRSRSLLGLVQPSCDSPVSPEQWYLGAAQAGCAAGKPARSRQPGLAVTRPWRQPSEHERGRDLRRAALGPLKGLVSDTTVY